MVPLLEPLTLLDARKERGRGRKHPSLPPSLQGTPGSSLPQPDSLRGRSSGAAATMVVDDTPEEAEIPRPGMMPSWAFSRKSDVRGRVWRAQATREVRGSYHGDDGTMESVGQGAEGARVTAAHGGTPGWTEEKTGSWTEASTMATSRGSQRVHGGFSE